MPDEVKLTLRLRPGKNALLLKVCQGDGDFAFYYAAKTPTVTGPPAFEDVSDAVGLGDRGVAANLPRGSPGRGRRQRRRPPRFPLQRRHRRAGAQHAARVRRGEGFRASATNRAGWRRSSATSPATVRPRSVHPAARRLQALPERWPRALQRRDRPGRRSGQADRAGDLARCGPIFTPAAAPTCSSAACGARTAISATTATALSPTPPTAIGLLHRIFNTAGLAVLDLNNDGMPDLVLNNEGQESVVLLGNPAWMASNGSGRIVEVAAPGGKRRRARNYLESRPTSRLPPTRRVRRRRRRPMWRSPTQNRNPGRAAGRLRRLRAEPSGPAGKQANQTILSFDPQAYWPQMAGGAILVLLVGGTIFCLVRSCRSRRGNGGGRR